MSYKKFKNKDTIFNDTLESSWPYLFTSEKMEFKSIVITRSFYFYSGQVHIPLHRPEILKS